MTTTKPPTRWPWLALIAPVFLVSAAFYLLQARLAGAGLVYGSTPPRIYFQTQVFAWLHYMRLFLVPVGLSADADWSPIRDWHDTRVLVGGFVAVAFVAASAWYARRRPAGRAVLFGAIWYYVALAPTSSFFPLSEMVNEHRPYLPSRGTASRRDGGRSGRLDAASVARASAGGSRPPPSCSSSPMRREPSSGTAIGATRRASGGA